MNMLFGLLFLAQVGAGAGVDTPPAGVAAPAAPPPPAAVAAPAAAEGAEAAGAAPAVVQAPAPAAAPAPAVAPATAPAAAPAAAPADQPQAKPGGGMVQTLIFFGVMILIFWLLIIRPQQKQRKKQDEFLGALKPGDKVITSSGFIGRIISIDNDIVNLELAKEVRVKIVKSQVVSNYKESEDAKS